MNGVTTVVLLYHITHIDNLATIFNSGGLLAQAIVQQNEHSYMDVANQNIQGRRSKTKIPLGPQGNLHDYVPFYFAARSPMLYSVCHQGGIEQEKMIYFMSNTETINKLDLPFVFTDAHAIMWLTNFFETLDDLDKIDWDVMNATIWTDDAEHLNRKSKRQAEFLVYQKVPLDACIGIAVMNTKMKQEVKQILDANNLVLPIGVRRQFYY